MSGTGRGVAVLSRDRKRRPQAATKVQEEEVQVPGSDLNSLFGKSDENKLDLKAFDWQTFDSAPSAGNSQSQEKRLGMPEKSAKLAEFMKTWVKRWANPTTKRHRWW